MKNLNKINELIISLNSLTKKNELKWESIESYVNSSWNERLRYFIMETNEYNNEYDYENPFLVESKSYYTSFNTGLVFIFYFKYNKGDYYIIALQNSSFSSIIELNNRSTNQESLKALYNIVENQFDDVSKLIDFIISEDQKR